MTWLWWLVAALLLGIVEILSLDFFFLMLAIGALSAAAAAGLNAPLPVQVGVFCVVSVLLLFSVRPWARRHLDKSTPNIHTNAQGLVGEQGVVLRDLVAEEGRIRLEGEVWSSRSVTGETITKGTTVTVVEIDGATAIVRPTRDPEAVTSTTT